MENKLRHLYALQQVDYALDELEERKGDLPAELQRLDEQHAVLSSRLAALEETMRSAFAKRDDADGEILSLKAKLEKYKKQQFAVRSNREYDALTREMDTATEAIARLEKEMEMLEGKATIARGEIEEARKQIEELSGRIGEKRDALLEVTKTTEAEEQKYTHEREKLAVRITKADVTTYERIRKAKKGKAIVPVKRGACGGCFGKVPPQKLLELRQNNRIFTCEHCGRILVSDEIVATSAKLA